MTPTEKRELISPDTLQHAEAELQQLAPYHRELFSRVIEEARMGRRLVQLFRRQTAMANNLAAKVQRIIEGG